MTMRVMAEAIELRARAYIYAHKNRSWEKWDKLRRRHAAQLQDQSSCNWLVPRTGPRCAGVLWASLVPTARSVQLCSCHLKACHHHHFMASSALRGDPSTMEEKRRRRAARDRPSRASSRFGWRHRFAPPEAPSAVAIGPAVASSITMASTAHLLMSELGDLSLQHGREGTPQRLLRHQAGSAHRLDGLRYAVDHVRPPSPPGRAGTRGYLEGQKTHPEVV